MSTSATTHDGITTGTWQLDAVHSRAGFAVDYMAGTFHGEFAPFDATLDVAEDGTATLAGSVGVESIKVQDENLGAHLLSPEFFDAERTPEIAFASSPFALDGDAIAATGKLTIKGVSRPVELEGAIGGPLVDPYGRERINLTLEATVDRGSFGLDWNAALPSGESALSQDVTITTELALVKSG